MKYFIYIMGNVTKKKATQSLRHILLNVSSLSLVYRIVSRTQRIVKMFAGWMNEQLKNKYQEWILFI